MAGAGVVSLGPDVPSIDLMPNDPVQTRRLRPLRSILRVEQRELRFRQMPLIPISGSPFPSAIDGRDYIRGGLQPHITENTRAILLHWMQEVCDECHSTSDVYPLACTYVDSYLALPRFGAVAFSVGLAPRVQIGPVARSKFQLLGTAALLVASKLREAVPLSVRRLVQFTDHSITDAELADQELQLVQGLSWHLAPITPCDLISSLVGALPYFSLQPTASMSMSEARGASASSARATASSSFSASSQLEQHAAGGPVESTRERNLWEFVRRAALRALYALSLDYSYVLYPVRLIACSCVVHGLRLVMNEMEPVVVNSACRLALRLCKLTEGEVWECMVRIDQSLEMPSPGQNFSSQPPGSHEANNNTGVLAPSNTPIDQTHASQTTSSPSVASQADSGVASLLPDLSTSAPNVSHTQQSSGKSTSHEGDPGYSVPSQRTNHEPDRLFRAHGTPPIPNIAADCALEKTCNKGAKRARGRPRASNATSAASTRSSRSRKSAPGGGGGVGGGGCNGGLAYRHTADDESNLSCTSIDSGCSGCSSCTNYQLEVLQEHPDLELNKLAVATSAALVIDSSRSSSSFSTPAVPAMKEVIAHPVMFTAPPMRRAASSLAPACAFYSPQVMLHGRNAFLSGVMLDPNTGCPLY